jgi:hypothetical protein
VRLTVLQAEGKCALEAASFLRGFPLGKGEVLGKRADR